MDQLLLRNQTRQWGQIGTTIEIITQEEIIDAAAKIARNHLEELDVAISRFRNDSELTKINAGPGQFHKISPLFSRHLEAALWAASATNGLCQPTLGKTLIQIGYDKNFETGSLDSNTPIHLKTRTVEAWKMLRFNKANNTFYLPKETALDLGSTGKALACDDILKAISAKFPQARVLVNLGGDIAVSDSSEGWPILLTDAIGDLTAAGHVVTIKDGGLASSSTLIRRWRRGDKELHHIIDPRTNTSADTVWSTVSVSARSCLEANVASTCSLILSLQAQEYLNSLQLPARLCRHDGQVMLLGGWQLV